MQLWLAGTPLHGAYASDSCMITADRCESGRRIESGLNVE